MSFGKFLGVYFADGRETQGATASSPLPIFTYGFCYKMRSRSRRSTMTASSPSSSRMRSTMAKVTERRRRTVGPHGAEARGQWDSRTSWSRRTVGLTEKEDAGEVD
uniref:Uncharacterized protein n=1 Tax=Nelumbo nucifera TaxID=4432 RepID=A0A822XUL9_NELNU|nr:TPA_asm: hypothetical protein HUJ06_024252 [Nelumbo nucifera]